MTVLIWKWLSWQKWRTWHLLCYVSVLHQCAEHPERLPLPCLCLMYHTECVEARCRLPGRNNERVFKYWLSLAVEQTVIPVSPRVKAEPQLCVCPPTAALISSRESGRFNRRLRQGHDSVHISFQMLCKWHTLLHTKQAYIHCLETVFRLFCASTQRWQPNSLANKSPNEPKTALKQTRDLNSKV